MHCTFLIQKHKIQFAEFSGIQTDVMWQIKYKQAVLLHNLTVRQITHQTKTISIKMPQFYKINSTR